MFPTGEGGHLVLGSRQYRKGIPPHYAPAGCDHHVPISRRGAWRKFRLRNLNEWIAVLFIIGSSCFAIAGFQAADPNGGLPVLRGAGAQNLTYFIGSLFFTTAAFLQWQQSIQHDLRAAHLPPGPWKWWDWRFNDAGYMASVTQFVGTLLFNLNTGIPLGFAGTWLQQDLTVWACNLAGSALFLISSLYGWVEVGHRWLVVEPRNFSWWIAASNLIGSVLFGISAVLSVQLPTPLPGEINTLASLNTAWGAIGFLVAAVLMLPEQADEPVHRSGATAPGSRG